MKSAEIRELVLQKAPESQYLEFKEQITSHHKEEFLKDFTSMANADGGIILVGIEEFQSRAERIKGVAEPDGVEKRIHNWLAKDVSPRPKGFSIATQTVDGQWVLVVQIPDMTGACAFRREADAPFEFWVRVGTHSRCLNYAEIRDGLIRTEAPDEETAQLVSQLRMLAGEFQSSGGAVNPVWTRLVVNGAGVTPDVLKDRGEPTWTHAGTARRRIGFIMRSPRIEPLEPDEIEVVRASLRSDEWFVPRGGDRRPDGVRRAGWNGTLSWATNDLGESRVEGLVALSGAAGHLMHGIHARAPHLLPEEMFEQKGSVARHAEPWRDWLWTVYSLGWRQLVPALGGTERWWWWQGTSQRLEESSRDVFELYGIFPGTDDVPESVRSVEHFYSELSLDWGQASAIAAQFLARKLEATKAQA